MKCQGDLLEIVRARHAVGGLAHLLHRREQEADQYRDDGNHHQELDEREPWQLPPKTGVAHGNLLSGILDARRENERRHTTGERRAAADTPQAIGAAALTTVK